MATSDDAAKQKAADEEAKKQADAEAKAKADEEAKAAELEAAQPKPVRYLVGGVLVDPNGKPV